MKKFILFFIFSFVSLVSNAKKEDLYGIWENDSVRITFTKDSLYIDAIGIEGSCYTYKVNGDEVIYQDSINELYNYVDYFTIVSLDKREISIRYGEDKNIFTFKKKK